MNNYQKILVAIDMTSEADEVIAEAERVAEQAGAAIYLLTAVQPVTYAYGGYEGVGGFTNLPAFEAEAVKSAQAHLEKRADALNISHDRVAVRLGKPANIIKDYAQEIGADLIVTGSHGRHGLGLLLGSTASGVLHGAPCDVLTVKIKEE